MRIFVFCKKLGIRFFVVLHQYPLTSPNWVSDRCQNHHFLILSAINSLFHYAHRVGHLIFTRFPPLDAQNDPVGSRL